MRRVDLRLNPNTFGRGSQRRRKAIGWPMPCRRRTRYPTRPPPETVLTRSISVLTRWVCRSDCSTHGRSRRLRLLVGAVSGGSPPRCRGVSDHFCESAHPRPPHTRNQKAVVKNMLSRNIQNEEGNERSSSSPIPSDPLHFLSTTAADRIHSWVGGQVRLTQHAVNLAVVSGEFTLNSLVSRSSPYGTTLNQHTYPNT